MHSGSSTLSVVAAEASEWDRHQRRAAETQTGSFHPIIVNADETRRLGVCNVAPLIVDRQFSSGWGGGTSAWNLGSSSFPSKIPGLILQMEAHHTV